MRRAIGAIVVLFILGGLFFAYRDARSLMARPERRPSATTDEGLTDPPNWKVELPADPGIAARQSRVGGTRGSSVVSRSGFGSPPASSPPLWIRKSDKMPGVPATYLPRDSAVEPPRATFLPSVAKDAHPKSTPGQSLVTVPGRPGPAPDSVADQEYRELLHHAQFLIKAGLAPVAKEPLQQILREAPGTSIAREARATLDTIRN
jgi:hypothetical protein